MAENKKPHSAPLWVWLLGLLPWIWIVPFNQYFWDDWKNAPYLGIEDLVVRWDGGAKHFLNPVVYFLLTPLGPWSFHLLMVISNLLTAVSLRVIAAHLPFVTKAIQGWIGPVFLVLPVFHARFAVAVLEYSLALAAFTAAWAISLNTRRTRGPWYSTALLMFAIGVPSLAVLYPVAWYHVSSVRFHGNSDRSSLRRHLSTVSYLVIPVLYAFIFSRILNHESYYRIAGGALVEFGRGLVVLLSVTGLLGVYVWYRSSENFQKLKLPIIFFVLSYISLLPYFATGYNPLSDFLPWRWRSEVVDALSIRLASSFIVLFVVAVIVVRLAKLRQSQLQLGSQYLVLGVPIGIGVLAVTFGPMDWESRHWLVAWPMLALGLVYLVSVLASAQDNLLLRTTFTILLISSLIISSEFLVDSLKQRGIVRAAAMEFGKASSSQFARGEDKVVVVIETDSSSDLNARFRNYRPFEWWGLIARGFGISPWKLILFEQEDWEAQRLERCDHPRSVMVVRPEVKTSRLEALIQMRVVVDLQGARSQVCSLMVRQGWPRT